MMDRAHSSKTECYAIPEEKPEAKPNPFKIGESVCLRDGTVTHGTVNGILGNQVLVAWDNVPGDPRWYHQDFVVTEKEPAERDRPPAPEEKPEVKRNPFKMGDAVRLRDGTFTNGTVRGILVSQVLVEWNDVPGDPQWYSQDFVLAEKRPAERDHASSPEDKPAPIPNPFNIGESVRLRDGTFTNGTVRGILVNQVLVEWNNVPGDPQWYSQDFILTENRPVEGGRAVHEDQLEQNIVEKACGLVARMDDYQRQRFIAHILETYK